eukprot:599431-Amphidinium_carterae.1
MSLGRLECAVNDYIDYYAYNEPAEFLIQCQQVLEKPFYILVTHTTLLNLQQLSNELPSTNRRTAQWFTR